MGITSGPSNISLNVDPLDATASTAQTTFIVKANKLRTKYDVWLSVNNAHHEPTQDIYLADKNNSSFIPLTPRLTGNSGRNRVDVNPAELQTGGHNSARPSTGNKIDGDGVKRTNNSNGTTYTITLTEADHLANVYADVPAGSYRLRFRANVALDD